ncbi:hypothetical protein [Dactylosporangium sp. NPDC048998]|uniref:hypothetical protein n=1 Tax=Dactylosporangium sp. NPDC048998 TaxID=3363976 RepID=UPI00371F3551
MSDNRPAWTPGHRRSSARYPGRRWAWRPLLMLGLPAFVVALGGFILTSQEANAGQDAAEVNCTLVVPANPLSANGLATPYRLRAPCHETDAGMATFVQATIVDPATGNVSVYNPLVVDDGKRAAVVPAAPKLPAGAVVGLWFGFNGDNLRLADDRGSLAAGKCVNGAQNSIFGQFAYCNAPAVFDAANAAIAAGRLTVPDLGTATDGRPCPTTRDFGLVDMDQSDNVTTTYLALADGTTAQNTAANRAALARRGARVEVNGSDNGLLDAHVFPALGCTPYRAPDLADAGAPATALALNELQAAAHQQAPVALVPTSDPMTKIGNRPSVAKTNLYRVGVGQPPIDQATETPTAYCRNLLQVGADRIQLDRALTVRAASPDPQAANSLFTFLAQRFKGSYDELDCPRLLRIKNPVTVSSDANGVVISARFGQLPKPTPSGSTAARPSASASAIVPTSAAPTATASASVPPTSPAASPTRPATAAAPVPTTGQPVHTAQPPQPVLTTQPPRATTQPPQPPPATTQPAQPVLTDQPTRPAQLIAAQPAPTDDVSGDGGAAATTTTGATAQPDGNLPGLAVDAMRLKKPGTLSALDGHSITATTVGRVLLVGGGTGFVGAIIQAVRRNRRS